MINRLREPFVHVLRVPRQRLAMLWIGVILFAGYRLQGAAPGPNGASGTPRISFRQVFFSSRAEAKQAVRKGATEPDSVSTASEAAPPDLPSYYQARSADEITHLFGKKFADALFQLRPGAWRGPIKSDYGWHIVWIE